MGNDELARYLDALSTWIGTNEAFANDLADVAADLKRSGRPYLAEPVFACSRTFRIRALELRGQLAAAKQSTTGMPDEKWDRSR